MATPATAEPDHVMVKSGQASLAVRRVGTGEGPTVVCLHAGVADSRSWLGLMEALAPEFDVLAYDRRGFGATECRAEAHDQVVDLVAVLDQLDIERAVLVGNSMGGRVALDAALVRPERVVALVLVAPAISGAPPVEPSELRADEVEFWDTLEAAEAAGDLETLNQGELRFWLDGLTAPEGRVDGERRALAFEMNRVALRAESAGHEPNAVSAWDRLNEVARPVLVVVGDLDASHMLARCRAVTDKIDGAQLAVMENVAHLPAFEAPGDFAAVLLPFLEANRS